MYLMINKAWIGYAEKNHPCFGPHISLLRALSAQDSPGIRDELAPQPFYVDYAAFSDTSQNTISLEVYYKIFSSALSFQKWGEKFKANYSVDIKISQKGKQVTGLTNDGSLVAEDYKSSLSKDDYVINKVLIQAQAR